MTDEEMTETKLSEEDYKLSEEVIKPIYYNATINDFSFAKYGVECYHAGLKAGRPKWHKVADGDLPKKEGEYLCYYTNADHDEGYLFYGVIGYYKNKFCLDVDGESWNDIVIAWCEIPKYTEE